MRCLEFNYNCSRSPHIFTSRVSTKDWFIFPLKVKIDEVNVWGSYVICYNAVESYSFSNIGVASGNSSSSSFSCKSSTRSELNIVIPNEVLHHYQALCVCTFIIISM